MDKFIAIDVGLKRIGVAFGVGSVVLPQEPILRKNRNQAAHEVSERIKEYGINVLVVGIPLGGSSEDEMRRRIEHFVSLLNFKGQIVYQDEAFSSDEASEIYRNTSRDGRLDSVAAMMILKRYLKIV
ncbi:Holliday junction resolvase RuvX [Campylobacter sp. faydin G-24]|uniref:Putative pre-16S rRNA nuclease n=1 Tax=Campylobacter anatolicus TaxID=2829105 RepID=A0ABS5HK09_9BACT|nr:Holliday junction resolvase RuvX [Campylobacter anatolicus]MBR8462004.1 Holliday junction resolvase RuvX [Campylobacter anatolicus]MBR8464401.1 Holliday junction resolvase RuvX [Campylobacter anatolicus]MBR8464907.1 Holliday junction resolvase RuvX [Campylobacter anatolicus]